MRPSLPSEAAACKLAPESRWGTTFDRRGRAKKKKRTRAASADNTGAAAATAAAVVAAAGLRCVCLRAREGAPAESRIRYRSISPGTGSGALLRFLYFIPPGSGPIKSALQYACRGTRLAFLVPGRVRTPARQLDARRREKKRKRVERGDGVDGCSRGEWESESSLLYFGGKKFDAKKGRWEIGLAARKRDAYYAKSYISEKGYVT